MKLGYCSHTFDATTAVAEWATTMHQSITIQTTLTVKIDCWLFIILFSPIVRFMSTIFIALRSKLMCLTFFDLYNFFLWKRSSSYFLTYRICTKLMMRESKLLYHAAYCYTIWCTVQTMHSLLVVRYISIVKLTGLLRIINTLLLCTMVPNIWSVLILPGVLALLLHVQI